MKKLMSRNLFFRVGDSVRGALNTPRNQNQRPIMPQKMPRI
jgi:hypothetical protein